MTKIVCVDCGNKCERTGSRQKRCPKCRRLNKLERYRKRYRKKVEEFAKRGLNYNYNSAYYKKHKKRIDLNNKRYYLRNRGRLRIQALQIIANNKPIKCAKHNEWNCCGDSINIDFLELDHKNNDGAVDRKRFRGDTFHRWIINHPKEAQQKLQILCSNAQWIKRRRVENKKIELWIEKKKVIIDRRKR